MTLMYADANDDWTFCAGESDSPAQASRWGKHASDSGFLQDTKVLYCPSFNSKTANHNNDSSRRYTYGFRIKGSSNLYFKLGMNFGWRLGKLQSAIVVPEESDPSNFMMLGDSIRTAGTPSYQDQMCVISEITWRGGVHVRHGNTANIAFADGHCEARNGEELGDEINLRGSWQYVITDTAVAQKSN